MRQEIIADLSEFDQEDVAEAKRRQGLTSTGWSKLRIESILVLMGVIHRDEMNSILREQRLEEIGDIEHGHTNLRVPVRDPLPWVPRRRVG